MKLLAISESLRSRSYNLALLHAMKVLCPIDTSLTVYDQIKGIPAFDPENDESL